MNNRIVVTVFLIVAVFCNLSHQQSCQTQANSDISSPDLAKHSGRQEWECCGICSGTPGCQGYAYNAFEGGTCWLKSTNGPIVWADGVSVGTLSGEPPVGMKICIV